MDNQSSEEQNETQEVKKEWILGGIILSIIILVFITSLLILSHKYELNDRALVGDSTGAVNTFFSALAFGGIIFTIILQRRELKLQRLELRDTRAELKRSANAQEKSNDYYENQLRLTHLPILRSNLALKYNKVPVQQVFRFELSNIGRTLFRLNISILVEDHDCYRRNNFIYNVQDVNDAILIDIVSSSSKRIKILLKYYDVLGNRYVQLIQFMDLTKLSHSSIEPMTPKLNMDHLESRFNDDYQYAQLDNTIKTYIQKIGTGSIIGSSYNE